MNEELKEKIMQRVQIDPETGCWNFISEATKDRLVVKHNGKQVNAKHLFFCVFIGDIFLKNIRYLQNCGNKKCVNPDHLQPITHLDYMRTVKKLDFCKAGHEMDEKNTAIVINKKTGGVMRRCKQCDKVEFAKKREKTKIHPLICCNCNALFIGYLSQFKNKEKGKNIFCCVACKNKHYSVNKL